ncbi:DNA ligase B [Striga asiatica]|uniref:DNA ligase B n=1 Tax=Striga asiatica TaxID=4170 RepID=A0A5A7NYE5_STRAF|nr:DNA ligase B [Striga asiatica]
MVTRRVFLSHHPTPPPPAGSSPITSSQRKKKKNRKRKPARRLVSAVSTPHLRQQARIFVSVRQRIGRRERGRATAEAEPCNNSRRPHRRRGINRGRKWPPANHPQHSRRRKKSTQPRLAGNGPVTTRNAPPEEEGLKY